MGAGAPSGRRCQWVLCTCLDGALDAAPTGEGPPPRLGLRHPPEWMAPELAPLAPVGSPRAGGLSAVLGLCGRLRSALRDPLAGEPRGKRIERQVVLGGAEATASRGDLSGPGEWPAALACPGHRRALQLSHMSC